MNKPVFGFHAQFKKGKLAEAVFIKHFKLDGEELVDSGVREYDFITQSGLKVELKTDYHDSHNFYIEYSYGREGAQKPGSFWQSVNKGADVFIYWFPLSKEVFIFKKLPRVVKYLDNYLKLFKPKQSIVQNYGFFGVGYKIQKSVLRHLYEQEELDVSLEELNCSVQA